MCATWSPTGLDSPFEPHEAAGSAGGRSRHPATTSWVGAGAGAALSGRSRPARTRTQQAPQSAARAAHGVDLSLLCLFGSLKGGASHDRTRHTALGSHAWSVSQPRGGEPVPWMGPARSPLAWLSPPAGLLPQHGAISWNQCPLWSPCGVVTRLIMDRLAKLVHSRGDPLWSPCGVVTRLIQVSIRWQRQKLDKLLLGNNAVEQLSSLVKLTRGILLLSNHTLDLIQFIR